MLPNAGVFEIQPALEVTGDAWREIISINLTGVWNTCKVALPHLIEGGRGGAIVITSSVARLKGIPNTIHYTPAKHGVVGIMRTLAQEFAPHSIRVNSVHPTSVNPVMIQNEKTWGLSQPDNPHPDQESAAPVFQSVDALPVPWVEPVDISNAILFLVSDEARHVTGVTQPIEAGSASK